MSWQISTRNIDRVRSYKDAANVFAAAPVLSKEFPNERGLESKRVKHKTIKFVPHDESYECRLYDTALVTYYKDGTVKLVGHDSTSSRAFLDVVMPYQLGKVSLDVECWRQTTYFRVADAKYSGTLLLGPEGEVLKHDDQGSLAVSDPKLMAQARKMLAEYFRWVKIVQRMTPEAFARGMVPSDHCRTAWLAMDPTKKEHWPDCARLLPHAEDVREYAYWLTGAKTLVPRKPTDRLPHATDHKPYGLRSITESLT